MRRYMLWLMVAALAAGSMFLTACDWSSGNDAGFNTSEGAGMNINFSGYYQGVGGKAVKNSSAGNIMTLTIQQGGDTVEVTDNQGSSYHGKIGSPGAVSSSTDGSYPAGAELAQAQINFSGHDNVAAKNVTFAGVIHAVAVTDIQGKKTTDTSKSSDSSDTENTFEEKWTTNITVGTTTTEITTTITIIAYDPITGDEVYRSVQTTKTTPGGTVISDNTTVTDKRTDKSSESDSSETTTSTEYSLTEANTQYRLQGTWIEEGGATANVDALSSGTAGLITTVTTTTTP